MADTVTKRFIYPPNWDETQEDWEVGHKQYRVHLTGICDGTGESGVAKVSMSDHKTPSGTSGSKFRIDKIVANVVGYTYVLLEFDRTTDSTIVSIGDTIGAEWDFEKSGGLIDNGSGDTGDILLTTAGNASGDTYDITISYRVK